MGKKQNNLKNRNQEEPMQVIFFKRPSHSPKTQAKKRKLREIEYKGTTNWIILLLMFVPGVFFLFYGLRNYYSSPNPLLAILLGAWLIGISFILFADSTSTKDGGK